MHIFYNKVTSKYNKTSHLRLVLLYRGTLPRNVHFMLYLENARCL